MEVVDVGGARSLRSSVSPTPIVSGVSIGGAPRDNCDRRQSQTTRVAGSCKSLGGAYSQHSEVRPVFNAVTKSGMGLGCISTEKKLVSVSANSDRFLVGRHMGTGFWGTS